MTKKTVGIDQELCIGCGKCVDLCAQKILYIDQVTNKCEVENEEICDKLRGCEKICPVSAIKIH